MTSEVTTLIAIIGVGIGLATLMLTIAGHKTNKSPIWKSVRTSGLTIWKPGLTNALMI